MKSAETPLHKVQGLGASHSGTGHFWRERVTSVALIPLSLWFAYAMLGLAGTNEVAILQFLSHPWNALLMAAFAAVSLYHAGLGLQVVIDDYVHTPGTKIFLLMLVRGAVFGLSAQYVAGVPELVPSWLFRVAAAGAGGETVLALPAVDPRFIAAASPTVTPSTGSAGPARVRITSYAADGAVLTLRFWGGVCSDYSASVAGRVNASRMPSRARSSAELAPPTIRRARAWAASM